MGAVQYKLRCDAIRRWASEALPGCYGDAPDKCVLLFGRHQNTRKVDIVAVRHQSKTYMNNEWRCGRVGANKGADKGVDGWVRRLLDEAFATSSSALSLFAMRHVQKHPDLYTMQADAPDKNVSRLKIEFIGRG